MSTQTTMLATQSVNEPGAAPAITVVVPFPAGGIDMILKTFLSAWSKHVGQEIKLSNRPGGTGAVGTLEVAQAQADGLTLLFASQGPLLYQPLVNSVGYDVQQSFVPVCRVTSTPSVLIASASSGLTCVADILLRAKNNATPLIYSSPGLGGLPHIGMAACARTLGIEMQHQPFAGAAAAIEALKQGQADLIAEQLPTAVALAGQGNRIIGVFAPERLASLAKVPTMLEQGCDLSFQSWNALMAPAGTATTILQRLSETCKSGLVAVAPQLYREMGMEPAYLSSAQTASFIAGELDKALALVRLSGVASLK
jgi:tripartite-type tricarboxylate transporter receptor subunit TctC